MAPAPLPQTVHDSLHSAYARWGVQPLFDTEGRTTPLAFSSLLEAIAPLLADRSVRLVPAQFDAPNAPLHAFPLPLAPIWNSCEDLLRATGAQRVMLRTPHFWQLEPLAHAASRAVGAALFVSEPENMPVGAAAIQEAGLDTVLLDARELGAFVGYLEQHGVRSPKQWLAIHSPETLVEAHLSTTKVFREVHVFPGVAVFNQCSALAAQSEPLFHTTPQYLLEDIGGSACITSLAESPLPLWRYMLPLAFSSQGACSGCGRPLIALSTNRN